MNVRDASDIAASRAWQDGPKKPHDEPPDAARTSYAFVGSITA
jgi:hypothetical protein